ncbi:glycoside hydrolase, family 85 [Fulvivirga imtechensis AK7]|uniref:Glycoside hydrolase, family 85 n=1 Tax=Fulvivirga imtechensis AK7 TaxID=1237149 RepID=L8JQM0_9BACT|nr:discoidin domain-containing protein [Fulvivirga imtechensis]ELR71160.1 glycoside hydrolase, family 85 [Fulvivirga imtechensis AK7]
MKNLSQGAFAAVLVSLLLLAACNDNENDTDLSKDQPGDYLDGGTSVQRNNNLNGDNKPPAAFREDLIIERVESDFFKEAGQSARTDNPYGLAVSVNSPYNGKTETTSYWGPPTHGIYWGGDWSGDFWLDNGNTSADFGNFISCYKDVYLDVNAIQYPGGTAPQAVKARLLSNGYACANQNYNSGGYTQQWEIIGVHNGVEYQLGWILYAHLASNLVYSPGTVLNLSGPVKIGTTFSTGSANGCWGSCHLHIELFNHRNWSCYDVNPPATQASRIGILGGLGSSVVNCPDIGSGTMTNWARNAINCNRSSAYSSQYDCNKAYDGGYSGTSKWVSDGNHPTSWMTLDLGALRDIREFKIFHAGSVGEPAISNIKAYQVQYSNSFYGPWYTIVNANNNGQASVTTHAVNLTARYVNILITDPGADNYTRIVEFEVNGN